VIICTPSKAGVLTALLITGPAVGDASKAKMLGEPSQRPTAKCCISIQVVSWAMVYVTPSAVIGSGVGATVPAERKLVPWAARCSRDLSTGGTGFGFWWFTASPLERVYDCSESRIPMAL